MSQKVERNTIETTAVPSARARSLSAKAKRLHRGILLVQNALNDKRCIMRKSGKIAGNGAVCSFLMLKKPDDFKFHLAFSVCVLQQTDRFI